MRNNTRQEIKNRLNHRFEQYKYDWKYKDDIEGFTPEVELYQEEINLLLEYCSHARKLNQFQPENLKEIEELETLLISKNRAFNQAKYNNQVESRYTLLKAPEQLDSIIFVLDQSKIKISGKAKNRGQLSFQ